MKLVCAGRSSSRYSSLPRWQAWLVLGTTIALLAWCLVVSTKIHLLDFTDIELPDGPDSALFREVVRRVRAGESYYDVSYQELKSRDYPIVSLFNWRLPTWAWVIGRLPDTEWASWLLVAFSFIAAAMAAIIVLRECGLGSTLGLIILLTGAFIWTVLYDNFLCPELWSGVLMMLSVSALGLGWRALGLGAGLLALAIRELALPYVVLATVLAWWEGRRREGVAWLVGLALFGAFLALHGMEVARRVPDMDRTLGASWVEFHGLHFVLLTCRMNALVWWSPSWGIAVYLVLSLLGLAGWRGPTGALIALTCFGYLAAFCVVGKLINVYWGWMYAPLLTFGLVRAPGALRDLFIVAWGKHGKC